MALIYETSNFVLETHDRPEVDRLEGGHMKISAKFEASDRTQFTPEQAVEFIGFSIAAGKAMKAAMARQGVEIGRINYQENGNWNPVFHLHLYGRATTATRQKYGDPIIPGHQSDFQPLNAEDIALIYEEIDRIITQPDFAPTNWKL